jgi:hypothetical protein
MGASKLKCRLCDLNMHVVFVPDKQNAFLGQLAACPLCDGTGKVDGVRWTAYQLLAAGAREQPTYEEIAAMVADLNSVDAHRIWKSPPGNQKSEKKI